MRSLAGFSLGFLLLACSGEGATSGAAATGELRLSPTFSPEPSVTGRNAMQLRLSDPSGGAVDGAQFAIELWMPAHGHGGSSVPTVTERGGGKYESDDLIFTMPGEWEVRILVDAGERHDAFVFEREAR
jgi:nitrogen fixation protein FixH